MDGDAAPQQGMWLCGMGEEVEGQGKQACVMERRQRRDHEKMSTKLCAVPDDVVEVSHLQGKLVRPVLPQGITCEDPEEEMEEVKGRF